MVDWTKRDREQRERLERNSPRGTRADVVGSLNKVAVGHAEREMPGLGAYGVIRLLQQGEARQARTAHQYNATFEKMLASGALDKRTRTPRDPTFAEPGIRPFVPGKTDVSPGAGDADAREENYVPPRRVGIVADAEGRMHGAKSTEDGANDGSDHWASGKVRAYRSRAGGLDASANAGHRRDQGSAYACAAPCTCT